MCWSDHNTELYRKVFCQSIYKSRTTFFSESIDHAGKKCRGLWNNHKLMGDNFLLKQLSCQTTFLICRQTFIFNQGLVVLKKVLGSHSNCKMSANTVWKRYSLNIFNYHLRTFSFRFRVEKKVEKKRKLPMERWKKLVQKDDRADTGCWVKMVNSNNSLVRWKSSGHSRPCTRLVGAHAWLYWRGALLSHKHEGRWVRGVRPSGRLGGPGRLGLAPNGGRARVVRGGRGQPRTCSDTMYPARKRP